MSTYTSKDFDDASPWDYWPCTGEGKTIVFSHDELAVVVAALRIAANATKPGLIEDARRTAMADRADEIARKTHEACGCVHRGEEIQRQGTDKPSSRGMSSETMARASLDGV